jgi:hypothetical protein
MEVSPALPSSLSFLSNADMSNVLCRGRRQSIELWSTLYVSFRVTHHLNFDWAFPFSFSETRLDSDHIAKHGLLSHLKYPITPGSLCTGEIVQIGNNVKGGFKLSHKVIGFVSFAPSLSFCDSSRADGVICRWSGVASHGCLAEYVVLNADYVAELKRKEGPTQQSYAEIFEAGRVQGSPFCSLSLPSFADLS